MDTRRRAIPRIGLLGERMRHLGEPRLSYAAEERKDVAAPGQCGTVDAKRNSIDRRRRL
jgi:hypothetical protein